MILLQRMLWGVGGVLSVGAVVKASIIGYYDRDVPLILGALVFGIVCMYLASKIGTAAAIDNDDDVSV